MLRVLLVPVFLLAGSADAAPDQLRGVVRIDGSSTVYPISEAIAEEFGRERKFRRIRVPIGVSGTGGGFKKFLAGETDINDASRRIKKSEIEKAKKNGIEFSEVPVAYDGISVIISKKNQFVDHLTVAELQKLWSPGSKVNKWSDIRKGWPDTKIRLYGPGPDSGTFEYFTKKIVGKAHSCRSDYTKSEDDNVLVKGIQSDPHAIGYLGFAYYKENQKTLRAVPIVEKAGAKPVSPTWETINTGTYRPLSRPVFIYVKHSSIRKPAVREFVQFYLEKAASIVKDVGYVPLSKKQYEAELRKIRRLARQ